LLFVLGIVSFLTCYSFTDLPLRKILAFPFSFVFKNARTDPNLCSAPPPPPCTFLFLFLLSPMLSFFTPRFHPSFRPPGYVSCLIKSRSEPLPRLTALRTFGSSFPNVSRTRLTSFLFFSHETPLPGIRVCLRPRRGAPFLFHSRAREFFSPLFACLCFTCCIQLCLSGTGKIFELSAVHSPCENFLVLLLSDSMFFPQHFRIPLLF